MLGIIIEAVSGQTYATYIKENLFDRIGMKNTFSEADKIFNGNVDLARRKSVQYEMRSTAVQREYKTITTAEYVPAPSVEMSGKLPAGGFMATARDVARFARAVHTGKVFTKPTQNLIYAGGRPEPVDEYTLNDTTYTIHYALGWRLRRKKGEMKVERIAHTGGAVGGAAMVAHFPSKHVTVCVLANVQDGAVEKTMYRIASLFLDPPMF